MIYEKPEVIDFFVEVVSGKREEADKESCYVDCTSNDICDTPDDSI